MELSPEPPRPSLAMSEQRVGPLVAAGYTNTEIAACLRVTGNAVEWSVAKLCRAFGVGSRDELAVRLRELSGS